MDIEAAVRRLSDQLGFRFVASLKIAPSRSVFHLDRYGAGFVLKCWPQTGPDPDFRPIRNHRLLALMKSGYQRLVVPEYLYDGHDPETGPYVVISYTHGMDYNARWHYSKPEIAGGLGLAARDIDLAIELIDDLRRMPVGDLLDNGLGVVTREAARSSCLDILASLDASGLLTKQQVDACSDLITDWARLMPPHHPIYASNVDFRHRNFIEISAEKTALIDWDETRGSSFEIEHCIAYQWLLIWNRPDLQARLLQSASERFSVGLESLRAVLILCTVRQSHICRQIPALRDIHIKQTVGLISNEPLAP